MSSLFGTVSFKVTYGLVLLCNFCERVVCFDMEGWYALTGFVRLFTSKLHILASMLILSRPAFQTLSWDSCQISEASCLDRLPLNLTSTAKMNTHAFVCMLEVMII